MTNTEQHRHGVCADTMTARLSRCPARHRGRGRTAARLVTCAMAAVACGGGIESGAAGLVAGGGEAGAAAALPDGSAGMPKSAGATAGRGGAGAEATGGVAEAHGGAAVAHVNGDPLTGALGTQQCPLSAEGGCPAGCREVEGTPVPSEPQPLAACSSPGDVVLDCAAEDTEFLDLEACYVSVRTGEVYIVGAKGLEEPMFLGWRYCTDEEIGVVQRFCPCCMGRSD